MAKGMGARRWTVIAAATAAVVAMVLLAVEWLGDDGATTVRAHQASSSKAATANRSDEEETRSTDEEVPDLEKRTLLVVNAAGDPLEGVALKRVGHSEIEHTDREGRVAIPHSDDVEATAEGYAALIARNSVRRLVLHRAWTLHGVVVDERGVPIPRCSVSFTSMLAQQDVRVPSRKPIATDGAGAFRFAGLTYGVHTVELESEGYVDGSVEVVTGDAPVRVVLRRLVRVSGIVVCNGERVDNAEIYDGPAMEPIGKYRGGWLASAGSRGFGFAVPPGRKLEIVAVWNQFGSRPIVVDTSRPGPHTGIVLTIDESLVLSSHLAMEVVDENGTAISQVVPTWSLPRWKPSAMRVGLCGHASAPPIPQRVLDPDDYFFVSGSISLPDTTNDDGLMRWTVPLPPGTRVDVALARFDLLPQANDPPPAVVTLTTSNDPGATATRVVMPRRTLRRIEARNEKKQLVTIHVLGATAVDANEGVTSWAVIPGRAYTILTEEDRVVRRSWIPPEDDVVTKIVVEKEADSELLTRSGKVVDRDGNPIAGAVVRYVPGYSMFRPTITLPDGRFQALVAKSGTRYLVTARGYGEAVAETLERPIVLDKPGSVRITVSMPRAWRPADWRLTMRKSNVDQVFSLDRTGRVDTITLARPVRLSYLADHTGPSTSVLAARASGRIEHLGPGRYEFRLWTDGAEQVRTVHVRPGERSEVRFAFR